jgi:hypothetical protein
VFVLPTHRRARGAIQHYPAGNDVQTQRVRKRNNC